MLPKYTITLANYFDANDPSISLVRSTLTVVEIPSDAVIETKEIWHTPKLVPDAPETLKKLEELVTETLEMGHKYDSSNPSNVKAIILREPFKLVKENEEYLTIVTGTEDLLKSGAGTIKNLTVKVGRNDLCICGSKKKFKKCCIDKALGKQQIQYVG